MSNLIDLYLPSFTPNLPLLFTKPVLGLEPCVFNSHADKLALSLLIPANQIHPSSEYQIKQWLRLALVAIIQAEPLWENHTELISFFLQLLSRLEYLQESYHGAR